MSTTLKQASVDFLSTLERREAASLGWGVTDGAFSWDELEELADDYLRSKEVGVSRDAMLQDLLDRALLFDFTEGGEDRVRTRMAEGVRLMASLRQLFPYHFPEGGPSRWKHAARLVSDYRFLRRPRMYPARHVPRGKLMDRLSKAGLRVTRIQEEVIEALVGGWKLADFQAEATLQILQDLDGGSTSRKRGVIVGAGTGTGKTLGFYLPALAYLAQSVVQDPIAGVRVLALYPRNELLKDQLSTALQRLCTLNGLRAFRDRALSVGALYGDVPKKASVPELRKWHEAWREIKGEGFVCPFLSDPEAEEGESGELIWRHDDIERGTERLVARDRPGRSYGPDVLRLTRDRMHDSPPDVLFSSTEMLNRSMSNCRNGRLYGVGEGAKAPGLVLLDEAHTYEGVTGAQVAYLLRRWTYAVRHKVKPVFVGLSATLASPRRFFADLTGVEEHRVSSIQASADESRSDEYLLVLRGDPFSGPSLLSTSIQAAMLLGRLLDPIRRPISEGVYGQRVFLFTDDLDVTNRFYDNLASAEGLKKRGGSYAPDPRRDSLAALRSPLRESENPGLFRDGQAWTIVEQIRHDLGGHLLVERVSSQDQGLASDASLVVATSSLEVGFDDDTVGAVLQHKAPRGTASYLQRKGRAGRNPEMRPWTCVVLSAYGRDQLAYQNYENLIDPVVETEVLPLGNRYVLRIQATLACLEWLVGEIGEPHGPKAWLDAWKDLARPAKNGFQEDLRDAYLAAVRSLLDEPEGRLGRRLKTFIQGALDISEYEAQVLLWEPPRSIFLGVLPTLRRRLGSNWAIYGTDGETEKSSTPLPEFMPHALFGDLNLPEVALWKPEGGDIIMEPVDSVLRNYAPGRVNRRHATASAYHNHWLPINYETEAYELDLERIEALPSEDLGRFQYRGATGMEASIRVMRPYGFQLSQTPRAVQSQSNAQPHWQTQIVAPSFGELPDGACNTLSDSSPLTRYVRTVAFFTHEHGQPIEVRRFTMRASAHLYIKEHQGAPSEKKEVEVTYMRGGESVALGFRQSVDAVGFAVTIPEAEVLCAASLDDSEQERALRTEYFRYVIEQEADLVEANVFQRGWVARLMLAALSRCAVAEDISLSEASRVLRRRSYQEALQHELALLADADIDPDTGEVRHGRHGQRLDELIQDPSFVEEACRHQSLLWGDLGRGFDQWLLRRFRTTLGAALLQACAELTPGRSDEGLVLDLESGPLAEEVGSVGEYAQEDRDIIWVSERTLGGTGLVEAVAQRMRDNPNQFTQLVLHGLEAGDFEQVSIELPRILDRLREEGEVTEATEAVRTAPTSAKLKQATQNLRHQLQADDILCTHSVFSALAVRLLRSGATRETEKLMLHLLNRWDEIESHLGIEIEPRLIAELVGSEDETSDMLPPVVAQEHEAAAWRQAVCYSLLWSRGSEVRALSLRPYHPYTSLLPTDRRLMLEGLETERRRVRVSDEGWRKVADDWLREAGHVDLVSSADERDLLGEALDSYLFDPVEAGYLQLYPRLTGLHQEGASYKATLVVEEVTPA